MTENSDQRVPRPEHPRPDFYRGLRSGIDWLNLNGWWEFDFDPADEGLKQAWERMSNHELRREILVPFPWESHLAWGTEGQAGNDNWFSPQAYLDPRSVTVENYRDAPKHTIGWYRRFMRVPGAWRGRRVFLNIGAADWYVQVWVNGVSVGDSESGYVPVSFDITEALQWGDDEVVMRVFDPEDHSRQPIGKQSSNWYTRTSGVWQTVWLEPRGEAYVAEVLVRPSLAQAAAQLDVAVAAPHESGDLQVTAIVRSSVGPRAVRCSPKPIPVEGGRANLRVDLADPIPWTPQAPHLYRVTVALSRDGDVLDQVHTYFGLRDVGVCELSQGGPSYICINGQPIYLRGALDQSFHPQGVYSFPSDVALKQDLRLAKQAGFNFLRLHIKAEDPRLYYRADQMGLLLMCDMPNFGYDGYCDEARQRWERTTEGIMRRDFNHPSIISWCLFNETWGLGGRDYADSPDRQAWVKEQYEAAQRLDPTRLVEDNSACLHDHVATDVNTWHFYINDYEQSREHIAEVVEATQLGSRFNFVGGNTQGDQPLLNSEYGGISARAGDLDVSWCFRFLTNELRKHEKICGYVYTELMDIEWERNGILNYDRSPKQFGYDPALLQCRQFVGLDCAPAQTVEPGAVVRIPVFLRPSREAPAMRDSLSWTAIFVDALGHQHTLQRRGLVADAEGDRALIELEAPAAPGLVRVQANLKDAKGRLAAMNFCYLEILGERPAAQWIADNALLLRRRAGQATAQFNGECEEGQVDGEVHLIGGEGSGCLDYSFELPTDLPVDSIETIVAVFEASSKRPGAPQTDADTWPSLLRVILNQTLVAELTLRNQPADSRGALSHMHGFEGRYGELVTVRVGHQQLAQALDAPGNIVLRLECERPPGRGGGLTVYGSRAGRYPCDAQLLVRLKPKT